jgi:hypothetical protein
MFRKLRPPLRSNIRHCDATGHDMKAGANLERRERGVNIAAPGSRVIENKQSYRYRSMIILQGERSGARHADSLHTQGERDGSAETKSQLHGVNLQRFTATRPPLPYAALLPRPVHPRAWDETCGGGGVPRRRRRKMLGSPRVGKCCVTPLCASLGRRIFTTGL